MEVEQEKKKKTIDGKPIDVGARVCIPTGHTRVYLSSHSQVILISFVTFASRE